jgi:hypothetical protein
MRELAEAEIRNNPRRMVRAIDYLLVTLDSRDERTPAGYEGPVDLPEGVRIERLERELAERLLDATELCGHDWSPRRQFSTVHAYVRTVWDESAEVPAPGLGEWDHDRRIWPTVQLSRLVRDTGTSARHAVRRWVRADDTDLLAPFAGFESYTAYRLYPDAPGYLDDDEAAQLAVLTNAYFNGPRIGKRLRRALRRVDSVTTERYLEDALPLVVGGLESLLKIGASRSRAQFAQRVPAVAAEVGVILTPKECKDVYDDRSVLVHETEVDLSKSGRRNEFARRFIALQETMRRAVRRGLEDGDFAAIFDDDANITARWPTVVKTDEGEMTI